MALRSSFIGYLLWWKISPGHLSRWIFRLQINAADFSGFADVALLGVLVLWLRICALSIVLALATDQRDEAGASVPLTEGREASGYGVSNESPEFASPFNCSRQILSRARDFRRSTTGPAIARGHRLSFGGCAVGSDPGSRACHVRRRDNLMAALHMAVETILVSSSGVVVGRTTGGRARTCLRPEEVLRMGSEPQVYAESILKVCEFYLESPKLVCTSGVTGADLKKRIEDIMTHPIAHKLDLARKVLIAVFGMAAVAGPIIFGLMNAPPSRAQEQAKTDPPKEFEVASIKPSAPGGRGVRIQMAPGEGWMFPTSH